MRGLWVRFPSLALYNISHGRLRRFLPLCYSPSRPAVTKAFNTLCKVLLLQVQLLSMCELIIGSGPFGPNEVRAIADSLGTNTDTHRELRLTVQELQQVSDLSPAASVRLGVALYLLGRSSEAVVSLKSGDGSALALFALGLAQAALAATDDACASFDAARTAGYPAGACLASQANTLRAANRLDEAVAVLSNANDEEKASAEYLAAQGLLRSSVVILSQTHSIFLRRRSKVTVANHLRCSALAYSTTESVMTMKQ